MVLANLSFSPEVLIRALDGAKTGVLLYDGEPGGGEIHRSTTFQRWAQEDGQRDRLETEISAVVEQVRTGGGGGAGVGGSAAPEPVEAKCPAARGVYYIRASKLAAADGCSAPAILVTIERNAPDPLGADSLTRRFGLSARESEIMRWLAEGKTKPAIAEQLEISPYTVNHHTERILLKLGVHSRAEAIAKIIWG
jgi:DNA-binding CsgD family transcriptional regulator